MNSVNYKSNLIDITYYFEAEEIDETAKKKEIESLKQSIDRREKLLSNKNYVSKAPKQIVDSEKKKLEEEKQKLLVLTK